MTADKEMIAWLQRTCTARKVNKTYGCDNFHCVYCRAARHIGIHAEHIDALTARVSRLLEAVEGMEKAIEPFRGAYDVKPPTADKWPDDKPLHECLPGIWPTWGDLKRLRESLATLRAAREGAR